MGKAILVAAISTLLLGIVCFVTIALLPALGGRIFSSSPHPDKSKLEITEGTGYPATFGYSEEQEFIYKGFMDGCVQGQENYLYCDCVITYMLQNYGVDYIYRASDAYTQHGLLLDGFQQAMDYCQ